MDPLRLNRKRAEKDNSHLQRTLKLDLQGKEQKKLKLQPTSIYLQPQLDGFSLWGVFYQLPGPIYHLVYRLMTPQS